MKHLQIKGLNEEQYIDEAHSENNGIQFLNINSVAQHVQLIFVLIHQIAIYKCKCTRTK